MTSLSIIAIYPVSVFLISSLLAEFSFLSALDDVQTLYGNKMEPVVRLIPRFRILLVQRCQPSIAWRSICRSTQLTSGEHRSVPVHSFSGPQRTLLKAAEISCSIQQIIPVRYASKDRKKEKKGAQVVELTPEENESVVNFPEYEKALDNLVEEFRDTLQKQFSLRTSSASFDSITVELEGQKLPLNNIAQITFKTPQLIMINLASTPTYVQSVVTALNSSGLNLNPQIEGHVIYLPVPKVSREHRETVSKNAKTALNKFKERIRAVQNTYVKDAKASVSASDDLIHNVVTKLMQLSEKFGKDLDALLLAKQKDLLGE